MSSSGETQYPTYDLLNAFAWKLKHSDLKSLNITEDNIESSNPGLPRSREEFLSLIDEVRRWKAQVARRRNANHVLINRLPVEILLHIFQTLQATHSNAQEAGNEVNDRSTARIRRLTRDVDQKDIYPRARPTEEWFLPLTGVCHHWRQLSISTPSLWQDISLPKASRGGSEFGRLCLARSFPAPVRIWLPSPYGNVGRLPNEVRSEWECFVNDLQAVADRIQLLDINTFNQPNRDLLLSLGQSRPNLLSLSIQFISAFDDPHSFKLMVSDFFQQLRAPNLERLKLTHDADPRDLPDAIFPNLTHLHLECSRGRADDCYITTFLHILRKTPHLQLFWLKSGSFSAGSDYDSIDLIALPDLREIYLRLHDSEDGATLLLDKLKPHEDVHVQWTPSPTPSRDTTTFPVFDRIRHFSCGRSSTPVEESELSRLCRIHSNQLHLPRDLSNRYIDRITNAHTIAMDKIPGLWFRSPSFFRSPATEHFHVDFRAVDINLLNIIERKEKPLFPNLTVMVVWHCPLSPLPPANTATPDWKRTLETEGHITRTKMGDRGKYEIFWQTPTERQGEPFSFEGLASFIGTYL